VTEGTLHLPYTLILGLVVDEAEAQHEATRARDTLLHDIVELKEGPMDGEIRELRVNSLRGLVLDVAEDMLRRGRHGRQGERRSISKVRLLEQPAKLFKLGAAH